MMTTDLPANIRFTFAGQEHRYSAVEINGDMVDVRRLLDWARAEAERDQRLRAIRKRILEEHRDSLIALKDR